MITASCYGRLGADPVARTTASGKEMVTASVCIDVSRSGQGEDAEWINIAAFGAVAQTLSQHQKGDLIAFMGRLTRSRYTGRDGQERASWGVTAEAIVSARTVRPGRRSVSQPLRAQRRRSPYAQPARETVPQDGVDDIFADGLIP